MTKDKATFLRLLEEHKGIIIKICNGYCSSKGDKDDLAQEIAYNLWKGFASYSPDHKFSTWLYRVALNVAISFYRKEQRQFLFRAYDDDLLLFEDESNHKEETERHLVMLQQYIHELKEIDRSLMLLYLDDRTYKEIAEITGISETNVATKLNRIKTGLRSKFSTN